MMNTSQVAASSVPTSGQGSLLATLRRSMSRNSLLFALLLLVIAVAINYSLQSNLFELRVLNGNLRVFLPLAVVVAGQAIVVIGGGIDLSVGAMVSLINTILVTQLNAESTPTQVVLVFLLACGAGILAGAVNGFFVAFLRLQPIVTTYATSFVFSGLALLILPRPGGTIPADLSRLYRSTPGEIPFVLYMMVLLAIVWLLLRSTRFGQFLYATGGKAEAAYATGVPVNFVRFMTYVLSGLFAALGAIALTMSISSGNARIGDDMTLDSIVAVVLGGTRLSGGQGGVIGPMIGVVILGVIRNIISFANVPTWSQTLVDALIIIFALAGPGIIRLLRNIIQSRVRA
jgi:ribose transport system permease protein